MKYINFLYKWTLTKASHPKAPRVLAIISFIESSIFPIPPDIILIPMILSKQTKAWFYAFICTTFSVLGGICGYLIGSFLFDSIGILILQAYNFIENFELFKNYYNQYGVLIVLGGGFTPFPYKLITIASGAFELNFPLFIIMSIISRGGRFFLIAALLWYFGQSARIFIENHLGKISIVFFIFLIGFYIIFKLT